MAMNVRESRPEEKAREKAAMKKWLASEEYKVYRKESLEANARLCMGEPSGAEFPPDPEVQKVFAKRHRALCWGVVDKYNADEYPGVEFTEED